MTADECIAIMVERVVAKFHSLKILLFGSHARGDAEPHSDIDLIIVFPFVEDTYKLMGEIRGAVSGLGFAKDVIVATPDDIERGANLRDIYSVTPSPNLAYCMTALPDKEWDGASTRAWKTFDLW